MMCRADLETDDEHVAGVKNEPLLFYTTGNLRSFVSQNKLNYPH